MKNLILPSVIFEELGLRYYGPIDGHDIPLLIRTFEFLKTQNEPVLLHILTQKGKGYAARARRSRTNSTASGNSSPKTGETEAAADADLFRDLRQDAGEVRRYEQQDRRHHRRDADRHRASAISQAQHPDSATSMSASPRSTPRSLPAASPTQGFKPFLAIYSTFMQRAYDMIIHDMALQNLNVALCMDRGGLSAATTARRTTVFSISATCGMSRTSSTCSRRMKTNSWTCSGRWRTTMPVRSPSAIRAASAPARSRRRSPTARNRQGRSHEARQPQPDVSRSSGSATCAQMARGSRRASWKRRASRAAVINPRWIKPLDTGTHRIFRRAGGSRSAPRRPRPAQRLWLRVIEHLNDAGINTPVVRIGWPDQFIEHGAVDILRKKHGLTAEHALERVLEVLQAGKPVGSLPKSAA